MPLSRHFHRYCDRTDAPGAFFLVGWQRRIRLSPRFSFPMSSGKSWLQLVTSAVDDRASQRWLLPQVGITQHLELAD